MAHSQLDHVLAGIREAALRAGRDPAGITLIAVSKTVAAQAVLPLIAAGQRHFGENRVQEAKGKWPDLKAGHADLRLHLIGPLQSNKAAEAVALFDAIHTVDRPKIAATIAAEMRRQQRAPTLFVQVNIGREPQKAGVMPEAADEFITDCRARLGMSIAGLMCIPPADDDPVPHFRALAALAKRHDLIGISMGMSGDYEAAVACGATHVRVGSALFGARN